MSGQVRLWPKAGGECEGQRVTRCK